MEAFSLLKYWRGGASTGVFSAADTRGAIPRTANSTTIITAVDAHSSDSDSGSGDGDDGPFFDLEFTAVEDSAECTSLNKEVEDELVESENENDGELNFMLSSSGSSVDVTDTNVSISPTDDLFFKGSLVPIEPSSLLLTASETNSKFPSSLLKSATKFGVLLLKLKKPKSNAAAASKSEGDSDGDNGFISVTPKPQQKNMSTETKGKPQIRTQNNSKLFTVKFKVEEVPIMSLFSRDNGSKSKTQKRSDNTEEEASSDDKKFSKDVMQKYLKMVKPLYIRVSKRYGGLTPLTPSVAAKEEAITDAPPPAAEKSHKQGNIPAKLRVVRKHLGKSKSASSAVVAAAPLTSNRRDDSLLQQQDAIQGAILHCKRSFNSSRGSESSILSRSASDSSRENVV